MAKYYHRILAFRSALLVLLVSISSVQCQGLGTAVSKVGDALIQQIIGFLLTIPSKLLGKVLSVQTLMSVFGAHFIFVVILFDVIYMLIKKCFRPFLLLKMMPLLENFFKKECAQ
ncbi:uncharacterized protein LOC143201006 [Rhynchophorus ferrugineus]|uniref:Uncharacterized protein n=1 Tax=Rhynchophorus ferrugineus TaxID=354439 RepID=A0A834MGB2_RHYFE|nr:hypothetical protein GWI33_007887 [Rhynchophorus ferrugineus]